MNTLQKTFLFLPIVLTMVHPLSAMYRDMDIDDPALFLREKIKRGIEDKQNSVTQFIIEVSNWHSTLSQRCNNIKEIGKTQRQFNTLQNISGTIFTDTNFQNNFNLFQSRKRKELDHLIPALLQAQHIDPDKIPMALTLLKNEEIRDLTED